MPTSILGMRRMGRENGRNGLDGKKMRGKGRKERERKKEEYSIR